MCICVVLTVCVYCVCVEIAHMSIFIIMFIMLQVVDKKH